MPDRTTIDRLPEGAFKEVRVLAATLQARLEDLEQQLNIQPFLDNGQNFSGEIGDGDPIIKLIHNVLKVGLYVRKVPRYLTAVDLQALQKLNTDYKGFQEGAGPPSTTEFPSNGDWGFYLNTGGPVLHLAYNLSGAILKVNLT